MFVVLLMTVVLCEVASARKFGMVTSWPIDSHMTTGVYEMCKGNGSACFVQPDRCLDNYPTESAPCKTIIALTEYVHGLNLTLPDNKRRNRLVSPVVNETALGLFMMVRNDPDNVYAGPGTTITSSQSAAFVMGKDSHLASTDTLFTCTLEKEYEGRNCISATLYYSKWEINKQLKPEPSSSATIKYEPDHGIVYYVSSASFIKDIDWSPLFNPFYATMVDVKFGNNQDALNNKVDIVAINPKPREVAIEQDGYVSIISHSNKGTPGASTQSTLNYISMLIILLLTVYCQ